MKDQVTPLCRKRKKTATLDIFSSFQNGERVYVKNRECWVQAVLKDISNDIVVSLGGDGQEIKCSRKELLHCTTITSLSQTEHLSDLAPLNEATVVHCLKERLEQDLIYTRAGSTVVALNPFKDIANLYSLETVDAYRGKQGGEVSQCPHIYQIGEVAYDHLHGDESKSQCIIVSGESGAGKTVSAKHLLRYLTVVANPLTDRMEHNRKLSECTGKGRAIEKRILDSNPILEAFGNASTPRNNNSSRFGKFIQLQFQSSGHIQGASIDTYLLEKTRVVHQGHGDCNFHIFYQLCGHSGSDQSWLSDLVQQLKGHTFNIVPPNKDMGEKRSLDMTLEAMSNIGLSETLQHEVFKVVAAIMFLCNIEFTAMDEDFSSLSSDSAQMSFLERSCLELSATCQATSQCCHLLGISTDKLEQVLLHRSIASGGNRRRSVFVKPVSIVEAKSRRDCLAMLLYSRLFEWLVNYINQQIQSEEFSNTIGLLDIYGFEVFETNSLEQLCINYANEKLQQHYVRHFLADLQKEYEEERIAWQHIDYYDNQSCLDVLEGRVGVFGVLNEEVYLNRKSNPRVLGERVLEVNQKSTSLVKRPKSFTVRPGFTIQHYAGDVQYDLEHITTKNKDNIPVELVSLLQESEKSFLCHLFHDFNTVEASGKKKKTVLTKFKASLDNLLSTLTSSDVHYIRCIKPNHSSRPDQFEQPYILQQLKASGVLETVEVCRRGYSSRLAYWDFLQRYGLLLREDVSSPAAVTSNDKEIDLADPVQVLIQKQLSLPDTPRQSNTPRVSTTPRRSTPQRILRRRTGLSSLDHTRKCCAAVITKVLGSQFLRSGALRDQFGKNKIFLLQDQFERLESARNELRVQYAKVIQRSWRRFLVLRERKRRHAVSTIWKYWKVYQTRKHTQRLDRAANCIQKAVKCWLFKLRIHKALAAIRRQTVVPGSYHPAQTSSRDRGTKRRSSDVQLSPSDDKTSVCNRDKKRKSVEPASDQDPKHSRSSTGQSRKRTPLSSLNGGHGIPRGLGDGKRGSGNCGPPQKKMKLSLSQFSKLEDMHVGEGVITRRKLAKQGMRFHTRESVLKNAHVVNRRELERGLTDCLLDD